MMNLFITVLLQFRLLLCLKKCFLFGILGTGTRGLSGQFPSKFIPVVKTPVQVDHVESILCRMFFHFVDIMVIMVKS